MLYLCLQTAKQEGFVALATPERLVSSASFSTERGRHGPLFRALADIQHRHKDLAGLLVVTGPGSWTSIRVGLAVAWGLSFSLRVPLLGMSGFEVLAQSQTPQDETRRGALFCSWRGPRHSYYSQWFDPAGGPVEDAARGLRATTLEDLLEQVRRASKPLQVHSDCPVFLRALADVPGLSFLRKELDGVGMVRWALARYGPASCWPRGHPSSPSHPRPLYADASRGS